MLVPFFVNGVFFHTSVLSVIMRILIKYPFLFRCHENASGKRLPFERQSIQSLDQDPLLCLPTFSLAFTRTILSSSPNSVGSSAQL